MNNNIIFIAHRINNINELLSIPHNIGIEIDLRDYNDNIILSHDPYHNDKDSILFDEFLKYYKHKFIILNIKSERIEYKILDLLNKYNIKNYFFLDCSYPMIHNLNKINEKNIAMRLSEYEPIEQIILNKDRIKWIWIDCFNIFPLTPEIYQKIKSLNLNICIVSPELQNHDINKISEFKNYIKNNNIIIDMICTKKYNIDKWI